MAFMKIKVPMMLIGIEVATTRVDLILRRKTSRTTRASMPPVTTVLTST